ncbi:proline-rich protein Hua1p [Trichomonascus vanleenenianus]|uniref:Hua1p n=1 Tax=Trichomonascus vanleenenianus TaxID=2268995 RepID=UPI003ECAC188
MSSQSKRQQQPQFNLPPEEPVPDEPPPPYSEVVAQSASPNNYSPPPSSHSTSRPPPRRVPVRPPTNQRPTGPPRQGYPGASTNSYSSRPSSSNSYNRAPPRNPNLPFQYPPGYWCYKCSNTGIKHKNGLSCQDCYARFAHQRTGPMPVQFLPPAPTLFGFGPMPMMPVGPGVAPRVVRPGDPSIGGVLCGRCRGRGLITEFLFEETCPTCRGIGRLL